MKIIDVIESKRWINKVTGQTASIYGAVPYTSNRDKANWVMESRGYTWQMDNGTIGLGRQPAKTKEEAVQFMDEFNKVRDLYASEYKKAMQGATK